MGIIENADSRKAAWRKLPPVGTRAWQVEWCIELPVNEFGDCEPDLAVYVRKVYRHRSSALRYAKEATAKAVAGDVCIWEVELTDPYGDGLPWTYHWEEVGEPEYTVD